MTCATCGATMRPGAMFCGECGAKAAAVVLPPPPPPPAPAVEQIPAPAAVPVGAVAASPPPPPPPPVATARTFAPPPPPPPVPPVEVSASPPVVAQQYTPAQIQPTVPIAPLPTEQRAPGFISSIPSSITGEVKPAPRPVEPRPVIDLEDDFDETIIAPRRGLPWTISGPDGFAHPIRVATVIGRAPARPASRPGAELLSLADDTKSLSKSHAIFEPDGDVFTVEDLNSTNGIVIVEADGTETEIPIGHRVPVEKGAVLEFGDFVIVIGRG